MTRCRPEWKSGPIRILAAEDERPHRQLLAEIFDDPEFSITFAVHGKQALDLLNRQEFDVLLLDNNMPEMMGMEVLRHVRANPATILLPVIMVTALSSHYDLDRGFKAGADDFVGKPYSPIELVARVRSAAHRKWATDQLDNAETILFALAHMVEARDLTTGRHCARLAHISQIFGRRLGLSQEHLYALRRGAVLHDIGKLVVPDAILCKPGPLTPDEREVMNRHSLIGAKLCGGLATMRDAMAIIRNHHERFDGTGYPDRLAGEAIPLLARVFQIVDIFDAIYNKRSYKEAFPMEVCLDILRKGAATGGSDPTLVQVFLEMVTPDPTILTLPDEGPSEGEAVFLDMARSGDLKGTRFGGSC